MVLTEADAMTAAAQAVTPFIVILNSAMGPMTVSVARQPAGDTTYPHVCLQIQQDSLDEHGMLGQGRPG